MEKYEKSCGAIIFKESNKNLLVLLVQMNKGHWSFPKGHMELDETEEQTSLRETKEETYLDIEIIKGFRKTINYFSDINTLKEVVYFLAKPTSTIIIRQEEEIRSIIWIKIEDALDKLSYKMDKKILQSGHPTLSDAQRCLE